MEMGLGDEEGYPHLGHADYTDPVVDQGTGTVRIRGVFPNPGGAIAPGQFVRVRLPIERREDALLVPSRALGFDQAGEYLLVVGKGDIVERRSVKVGTEEHGMRVVDGNIGPTDRVVVDGLLRARPGLKVEPKLANDKSQAIAAAESSAGNVSQP
jgi:membrane fusion protein (multidrug efflux system)